MIPQAETGTDRGKQVLLDYGYDFGNGSFLFDIDRGDDETDIRAETDADDHEMTLSACSSPLPDHYQEKLFPSTIAPGGQKHEWYLERVLGSRINRCRNNLLQYCIIMWEGDENKLGSPGNISRLH